MAGAGYKLFNTGDVLTAAQVNTYLQEQTVMVFANSTARTTALSGVLAEGMVSYLQDTNAVEVYNGSAWVGVSGAGDVTEVQAGTGISVASGTGPIPVVTNTMATEITAAGDIIVGTGSGTFDNLPIGTTGQILTADTTVSPYKVKWATAAASASGLTLITSTTISNATSKSIDSCFTSTYANYLIKVVITSGASDSGTATLKLRASSTDTSTNYDYRRIYASSSSVTTDTNIVGTDEFLIGNVDKDNVNGFDCQLYNPQAATHTAYTCLGSGYYNSAVDNNIVNGTQQSTTQFDGFTLLGNANMTGTIRVYGYQNS